MPDVGIVAEPCVEASGLADLHRETGVLVDDPGAERGRFKEEDLPGGVALRGAEFLETGDLFREHFIGEDMRALSPQQPPEIVGEKVMSAVAVDHPDRTIAVEFLEIPTGEMGGDERRIGPVQEPRRQPVVLGQRDPVPEVRRLMLIRFEMGAGVFLEIAQQVFFQHHLPPVMAREPRG